MTNWTRFGSKRSWPNWDIMPACTSTSWQKPRKTLVGIVGVPVEISNPEPPKNQLTLSLHQPARSHSFGGPKQWGMFYRFSALRLWNEYKIWGVRGTRVNDAGRSATYSALSHVPFASSSQSVPKEIRRKLYLVLSSRVYLLLCNQ